jgi:CTP synthase
VIVEIGGTAGDIESLPFLEAIRQMRLDEGVKNTLYVHLTLVPYIAAAGELKTKPTQNSVKDLRSIGITPDILLCRADRPLSNELKQKIALFCNVSDEAIITAQDVDTIYKVPLVFEEQALDRLIISKLELEAVAAREADLDAWRELVTKIEDESTPLIEIGVVGKYVEFRDAYKSLCEALTHGGLAVGARVSVKWIESEELTDEFTVMERLGGLDAILIPGGFGSRGVDGKIRAISFAREFYAPLFGICLGMQLICIEFARAVCGLAGANSTEFDEQTSDPIIFKLRDLVGVDEMGGTMRLGSYPCRLAPDSLSALAYDRLEIAERHRHRFEFNPDYRQALEQSGLLFAGTSPDNRFVEIVELPSNVHPWFLGCQFHPELRSKPLSPHPLFASFVQAAIDYRRRREQPGVKRTADAPVPAAEEIFTTPSLF